MAISSHQERIETEELETKTLQFLRRRKNALYLKSHRLEPMQEASRLGGNALALYLMVLHRLDVTRSSSVTLSEYFLKAWGIESRTAKSRALRQLEAFGLIVAERVSGRSARISLPVKS